MSEATIALLSLSVTLVMMLAGFIWWTASTSTEHRLRIGAIETNQVKLVLTLETLEAAVTKLDKHLAVTRASQGQFSESDSPPR